jgi:hypothetical protein
MAIYIDFVTAPYAASSNQLAMLFVYNGLAGNATITDGGSKNG